MSKASKVEGPPPWMSSVLPKYFLAIALGIHCFHWATLPLLQTSTRASKVFKQEILQYAIVQESKIEQVQESTSST